MKNKDKDILQRKIVDLIPDKVWGRLVLAPRIGKSRIAILLIQRLKPKSILWITSSRRLADKDIKEEFVKWKAKRYLPKLTTGTWRSLAKATGNYDLILLDEDQNITESNAKNLISKKLTCTNLLSFTGVASTSIKKVELYEKLKLKAYITLDINQAVELGLLSPYTINVVHIPYNGKDRYLNSLERSFKPLAPYTVKDQVLTIDKPGVPKYTLTETALSTSGAMLQKIVKENGSIVGYYIAEKEVGKITVNGETFRLDSGSITAYVEGGPIKIYSCIKRNPQKIAAVRKLRQQLQGKNLFFVGSIATAETLSNHTYHSKQDATHLEAFQNDQIRELFVVNSGGVGFTYKGIENLILSQVDSDRNGNSSQKICRTLLAQDKYKATIWLLCLDKTRDEEYIKSVLKNFNPNYINHIQI